VFGVIFSVPPSIPSLREDPTRAEWSGLGALRMIKDQAERV